MSRRPPAAVGILLARFPATSESAPATSAASFGWAFRRFIRLALALLVLAALLVSLGKYAGWDTSPAETKVKESATWV